MRLLTLLFGLLFFIITSSVSANEAMKHYEQALSYLNEGKLRG